MSANRSVRSAAPDGLEARLARLGLRAEGARERQAALSRPLQGYHRALLGAFLAGTGPPALTVVGRLAAELELEPQAALAALAVADLVHIDPGAGTVSVAYPFSGRPTLHRVELADGPTVHAMCALDALGIPQMTRRDARISATDPVGGQPITVEARHRAWQWEPVITVVLVATAAGGVCGTIADWCCPHINFHTDPQHAQTYLQAHPGMTGELLGQADAVATARRIFGGLLDHSAAQAIGDDDLTR